MSMGVELFVGLAGLYVLWIVLWFGLSRVYGDGLWWLALINPFAALFFIPLPLLLVANLWVGARSVWWMATIPAAIFLWLYGPYFAHPRRRAADRERTGEDGAETLTLMTFNLWWRSRERATARVPLHVSDEAGESAAQGPDVVAVQELMPEMAELLHQELAHIYPHRQFVVGEEMQPPRRLGVLSRYPLTPVDAEHLVERDFRVQIVRVEWPTQPFLLYNIHPRATLIVRYLREAGPLAQKVRRSFAQRTAAFQRLSDDIAGRTEPVVVVGDFNSTDQSDAYRHMARVLHDAHRVAGWGLGHTFPMHGADLGDLPLPPRLMRLDMIFYSEGLAAQSCRAGRVHGESDHLPVIARFRATAPVRIHETSRKLS